MIDRELSYAYIFIIITRITIVLPKIFFFTLIYSHLFRINGLNFLTKIHILPWFFDNKLLVYYLLKLITHTLPLFFNLQLCIMEKNIQDVELKALLEYDSTEEFSDTDRLSNRNFLR
jgi:hypothetical protein